MMGFFANKPAKPADPRKGEAPARDCQLWHDIVRALEQAPRPAKPEGNAK